MSDRYQTPDGWTFEVIQLTAGERLRMWQHSFYAITDVANVD